ncbi:MAG: 30S ribosomal protein S11 [Patescibacteria group bacterium]|nr:30S ribosomal protein S11 [Patescibacteria group bacterium]
MVYKPSRINKRRSIPYGRIYIQTTHNNTVITITDENGNAIGWASGGNCSGRFKGPRKATPYAASVIVTKAVEIAKSVSMEKADIYIKGVGRAREQAVRAIQAQGIDIISISDVTPVPHNGCRRPGPRRM